MTDDMNCRDEIHVIIVNFRTPDLTIRCVESILSNNIVTRENIIVIDNASGDDSVAQIRAALPEINVKVSTDNGGFGAGVNLGAESVSAKYLLVLNPDTYFEQDSVTPVLKRMDDDPDIGIASLDLINPDGTRQYGARRFYSLLDIAARRVKWLGGLMQRRIRNHLMIAETERGDPFEAEWVMGTGIIIRSDVFKQLDGLDQRYFLYMEDVDLCARVWTSGSKVVYFPGFPLVHDHQRQSAASPISFAGRTHLRSLALFASRFSLPLVRPPGIKNIRR